MSAFAKVRFCISVCWVIACNVLESLFLKVKFIISIRDTKHPFEIDLMGIDHLEFQPVYFSMELMKFKLNGIRLYKNVRIIKRLNWGPKDLRYSDLKSDNKY